ncbi:MAG: hypothetical protein REI11_08880, partial [Patulibacter sp.]|nr:hypothetical protein [Patulibacter sp.]
MHVQLVDPAAYTPPYDHALASALARAGARVDLVTTASPEWEAAMTASPAPGRPAADGSAAAPGYARHDDFYRRSAALPGPWRQA